MRRGPGPLLRPVPNRLSHEEATTHSCASNDIWREERGQHRARGTPLRVEKGGNEELLAITVLFYGFSDSTIIPQLITLDVITAAVVDAAVVITADNRPFNLETCNCATSAHSFTSKLTGFIWLNKYTSPDF